VTTFTRSNPNKSKFVVRNILPLDALVHCVLCNTKFQKRRHICFVIVGWRTWCGLGLWGCLALILFSLIICSPIWSVTATNKKLCKSLWLCWHATIWVLWKSRNDNIFNKVVNEVDEFVE